MNDNREHEVTFLSFALHLWEERLFLIVCVLAFLFLTGFYIIVSTPKYTATILINHAAPVQDPSSIGGISMGGALSLLGSSDRDPKFELFLTIIKTENFARRLERKYHFIERAPAQERIRNISSLVKLLRQVNIDENVSNNTAKLSLQLASKKFAARFLLAVYKEGNLVTRRIYARRAEKFSAYLEDRIKNEPNRSLQDALGSLLEIQERFLMVTKVDLPYAAQLLDGPSVSNTPTSPKVELLLAIALFVGFILGLISIMVWDAVRKERRVRGYETAGPSEMLRRLVPFRFGSGNDSRVETKQASPTIRDFEQTR